MKVPEIPANEPARLQALRSYDVLDTPAEPAFDALTTLAAHIAGVPIALVSLVDADRQWFKSRYGLDAPETPRDVSFCGHVVAIDAPLIVPDAWQDERFADNPLVTGAPRVRFYAGFPLRTEAGLVLGTLCTIDHLARELTDTQREMLNLLARQVIDQLELRRKNMLLAARLREVETYRSFFVQSLDLLCTIDDKFRFQEVNPIWQDVLGWTPEELRGVPFTELVHPDDLEGSIREARRLLEESSSTVNFENRYCHKDGRWVPFFWVATVRGGTFFAAARDVSKARAKQTELEATLEEVSEARSRVQSILASANSAIIETMPDGTIREFNAAAERMLGYSASEVIGKVSPAIFHVLDEVVARTRSLSAELGVAMEPGFETFVVKARWGIPDENEWTYIRKDGSTFPVDLSVTARHAPNGDIVGFVGIARDVSARKRAEAKLRESEVAVQESETRLRSIIDTAVDAMITIDERGLIERVNPAAARHGRPRGGPLASGSGGTTAR